MALTKVSTGLISADLASVDLNIDANTLYIDVTNNRVGINNTGPATALDVTGTVTADGLTVTEGSSGATANANADGIVVENNGKTGISILTPNTSEGLIFFGDSDDNNIGRVAYNHSTNAMSFVTNNNTRLNIGSGGDISFYDSAGSNPKFFWDASAETLRLGDDLSGYSNTLIVDQGANYDGTADTAAILVRDSVGLSGDGNYFGAISFGKGTGQSAISAVQDGSDSDQLGLAFWIHGSSIGTDAATRAMTLDASGNLLVGKDTTDFDTAGVRAVFNGQLQATASGNEPLDLNRLTSDGDLIRFYRGALTPVGSIGAVAGVSTYIHGRSGYSGLTLGNGEILPCDDSGANRDAAIDLGDSTGRFKDLYLSGDVIASGTPSSSVVGVRINNSGSNFDLINTSCGSATTAKTHLLFTNGNGNVGSIQTDGSATSYNTSSDYRLKENVVAMSGATERLKQLKPSRFNFIADPDTTVDGFLAHEVQDVVPEAITGTKDAMRDEEYEVTPAVLDDDGNVVTDAVMGTRSVPKYQGIDQSKLVPLLVATIQELEARIAQLEGAN